MIYISTTQKTKIFDYRSLKRDIFGHNTTGGNARKEETGNWPENSFE